MIRRRVSAALLLRDGFAARPFASGAGVLCRLDGRPIRPVWKTEGYFVLTDLEAGEHTLELSCRGYRDESLTFASSPDTVVYREIDLKPGIGYAFPADTAYLRLRVSVKNKPVSSELWAGVSGPVQLRLAQDQVQEDAPERVRLFCQGLASRLPIPGSFLLADEKGGELVHLLSLRDEDGTLECPMEKKHPRGTELFGMQCYRTDADGRVELIFPRGGNAYLFCRTEWTWLELHPGGQEMEWKLTGK